jgi:hypothetical protein
VVGDYLYVFGGHNLNSGTGTQIASVERAKINSNGTLGAFATVNGINLATARQSPTTAVFGSSLYLFGGWDGTKVLNSVERAPLQ